MFCYRESDCTVYVVFRGTESWRDAVADASVYKRPLPFMQETAPGARVHGGFLGQYEAVLGSVDEYLGRHRGRRRVVVTGHSLGAAIAVLCAARLKDERRGENVRCVAFGCPRVGNSAFARRAEEIVDIERYVVGNDPVTDVPTRLRWKHAGRQIRYVGGKRVKAPPGDGPARAFRLPNPFCASDHAISGYIDCLAADRSPPAGPAALAWWQAGPGDAYFCLAWAAIALAYIPQMLLF
jgi:pimeloyl-ACP methyl ester carboxylesterase